MTAWQTDGGQIVFAERGKIARKLELPCGQCIGCRLKRAESWAVRCVHESKMHSVNSFITLTYNDDNIPAFGSLHYPDFQKFCKRMRKKKGPFRFFMCGEYGEDLFRPHYHACLFGLHFEDRKLFSTSNSGHDLYTSKELSELWPYGYHTIGDMSFQSAAYVARYCVKKVTGPAADEHYMRMDEYGEVRQLEPEFIRMSLKPGIGAKFYEKYKDEILVRDSVILDSKERSVPRYYDKALREIDGFRADEVQYDRYLASLESKEVITQERLNVQEEVTKARLKYYKRTI